MSVPGGLVAGGFEVCGGGVSAVESVHHDEPDTNTGVVELARSGSDGTVVAARGRRLELEEREEGCGVESLELMAADGVRLEAAEHPAEGAARGWVVLAHGITVDLDEGGGMFVRLAQRLASAGLGVLRFSFRGHGGSGGSARGVTIAGERLDLEAAVSSVMGKRSGPVSVVAASFGAVVTCLSLAWLEDRLRGLVLWNPVLDLTRTFVEPELPWGIDNFGRAAQQRLARDGVLVVDGEFELGRVLFEEFSLYRPQDRFIASRVPALVVHGDRDTAVSYEVAKTAARARGNCAFHTVVGSDHGFDSRQREDEAIGVTADWLAARYPER